MFPMSLQWMLKLNITIQFVVNIQLCLAETSAQETNTTALHWRVTLCGVPNLLPDHTAIILFMGLCAAQVGESPSSVA